MKKPDFIYEINQAWNRFLSSWRHLEGEQMVRPDVVGTWSVKDLIAHVTWYEQEMIAMLKQRALIGSPHWDLSLEKRNEAIFREYKNHTLSDVLMKSKRIHQTLMNLIDDIQEDELLDASHFRDMPSDWSPWQVIASNTFEHYADHGAAIEEVFY